MPVCIILLDSNTSASSFLIAVFKHLFDNPRIYSTVSLSSANMAKVSILTHMDFFYYFHIPLCFVFLFHKHPFKFLTVCRFVGSSYDPHTVYNHLIFNLQWASPLFLEYIPILFFLFSLFCHLSHHQSAFSSSLLTILTMFTCISSYAVSFCLLSLISVFLNLTTNSFSIKHSFLTLGIFSNSLSVLTLKSSAIFPTTSLSFLSVLKF